MDNFIWHNPRCSKSRQTLQLIEEAGVSVRIIPYLEQPPSAEDLMEACKGLDLAPQDIVRSKESLFAELGLSLKDARSAADWCALLSSHPKLIERPIVRINGRYALGRPPENVQALL